MSHDTNHEVAQPEPKEQPTPDPTSYGMLVDRMVATVATWPREYQRSVDVHHLDSQQQSTARL